MNVFEDLVSLFNKYSPDLEALFETATFKTSYCEEVGTLKLSPNYSKNVVRFNKISFKKQGI